MRAGGCGARLHRLPRLGSETNTKVTEVMPPFFVACDGKLGFEKSVFFGKFFPVVLEAQKPFLAVLKFFVYVILTFYYFYVTDVSWSGV